MTNLNAQKIMVTVTSNSKQTKFEVNFMTAVEMIHIGGMSKWESTAPHPGKYGYRNGVELQNSQQARLQYLLEGVGFRNPDDTYSTLATRTRCHRTFDSKITRTKPAQGLQLPGGWHLNCCLNLGQKLEIVGTLRHLGYSRRFIDVAKRFVIGSMDAASVEFEPELQSITSS